MPYARIVEIHHEFLFAAADIATHVYAVFIRAAVIVGIGGRPLVINHLLAVHPHLRYAVAASGALVVDHDVHPLSALDRLQLETRE